MDILRVGPAKTTFSKFVVPKEIKLCCDVEDAVADLTPENAVETAEWLLTTDYSRPEYHDDLIEYVVFMSRLRPKNIDGFVLFIKRLLEEDQFNHKFRTMLLHRIFTYQTLIFLRKMVDADIFRAFDIPLAQKSYKNNRELFVREINTYLIFMPELCENNSDSDKIKIIKKFCKVSESVARKYLANDMEILKQIIREGAPRDTLLHMVRYDRAEDLEQAIKSKRLKDGKQEMDYAWLFDSSEPYDTSIFGIAAYFGSRKCLDVMLKNGFKLRDEIMEQSCSAGDLDFVKKCVAKGCSLEQALQQSVAGRRRDVFEWIWNKGYRSNVTMEAVLAHDTRVLAYQLENNVSPMGAGPMNMTLLHIAVKCGGLPLVKYLSTKFPSVMIEDSMGKIPYDDAVRAEKTAVADYLKRIGRGKRIKQQEDETSRKLKEVIKQLGLPPGSTPEDVARKLNEFGAMHHF